MRRKLFNKLVLILNLIATITFSSCNDGNEPPMKDGNLIFEIKVSVIDKDGKDLVQEWFESDRKEKLTEAEYIRLGKKPENYSSRLLFIDGLSEDDKMYFISSYDDTIDLNNDTVIWRFKMYDTDTEEISLIGKCVEPNDPVYFMENPVKHILQWSFKSMELPIPYPHFSRQSLTLVRSDDGSYTML